MLFEGIREVEVVSNDYNILIHNVADVAHSLPGEFELYEVKKE